VSNSLSDLSSYSLPLVRRQSTPQKRGAEGGKVAGVFPSYCPVAVSARLLKFHWAYTRDRKAIVIPFMRGIIQMSRNFATLALSELKRSLTQQFTASLLHRPAL
jgi:hypothetical protein